MAFARSLILLYPRKYIYIHIFSLFFTRVGFDFQIFVLLYTRTQKAPALHDQMPRRIELREDRILGPEFGTLLRISHVRPSLLHTHFPMRLSMIITEQLPAASELLFSLLFHLFIFHN